MDDLLSNWKIGRRLTLAFTIALVVVAIVAGAGFWGVSRMVTTADTILNSDAKLMQLASSVEAKTLSMRHFEKEIVLNAGNGERVAEYTEKWRAARQAAAADLIELRRLSDPAEEGQISAMQKALAVYATGFEEMLRLRTPVETASAIDAAATALAARQVQRLNAKRATVAAAASRTRAILWTVCISGVMVVFAMAVRITRSTKKMAARLTAEAHAFHGQPFIAEPGGVVPAAFLDDSYF